MKVEIKKHDSTYLVSVNGKYAGKIEFMQHEGQVFMHSDRALRSRICQVKNQKKRLHLVNAINRAFESVSVMKCQHTRGVAA